MILPLPPSTNHLFKTVVIHRGGKQIVVRAPHGDYTSWKNLAAAYVARDCRAMRRFAKGDKTKFHARVLVGINYTGDIENRLKAIFDFLSSDGIRLTPDDRYLDELHVKRGGERDTVSVRLFFQ